MADNTTHRVTATVTDEVYQVMSYWSKKNGYNSVNEFTRDAIDYFIRYQNKDYDLPTLEIARLNQLIDVITVLSKNVQSLEHITVSGFDSLLGLTRGDNYLLENESGDI